MKIPPVLFDAEGKEYFIAGPNALKALRDLDIEAYRAHLSMAIVLINGLRDALIEACRIDAQSVGSLDIDRWLTQARELLKRTERDIEVDDKEV